MLDHKTGLVWCIPELAESLSRSHSTYTREDYLHIISMYAINDFFNGNKYINI